MKSLAKLTPTLALLFFAFAGSIFAYEVKAVADGGTVTGTVSLVGEVAEIGRLEVTKDKTACGMDVLDETLITKDGMIRNVVISIEGITAGKKPDEGIPTLSNLECRFVPHVLTVQTGTKLVIDNADPILHNTHGIYEDGRTAFNLALPLQNQKIKKRIKKPGVITLKCDAGHTWMSAYVHAFDHPYHAVTGEEGSFTITDVPPGTYTLTVWHEALPPQSVEVTVEAGKTGNVNIEMKVEE